MNRFEEVATFVEIASVGSISAAAKRLGVSKSMVSRRLKALETRLQTQLVLRTTRTLRLTANGQQFLERCRDVVAQIDAAESAAAAERETVSGQLRVTLPVSFGRSPLGPIINAFAARHPELELHLSFSDHRENLFEAGYEMAIRVGRLPDSSLMARRLCTIPLRICASPSYWGRYGRPDRPEDLATHRALVNSNVGTWSFRVEGEPVVRVRPRIAMLSDNTEALRDAAIMGLGVMIGPGFIVDRALQDGLLEASPLSQHLPPISAYVLFPPGQPLPVRARLFVEHLATELRQADS
jgi:DNA-binding transcriptional LysR family regulator